MSKSKEANKTRKETKQKQKRASIKEAEEEVDKVSKRRFGFFLTLLSGFIIIGGGVFALLVLSNVPPEVSPEASRLGSFYLSISVINGAFIIAGGALSRSPQKSKLGAIMSIMYSISAIFVGFGLLNIIGAVVGVLGGILTFLRR